MADVGGVFTHTVVCGIIAAVSAWPQNLLRQCHTVHLLAGPSDAWYLTLCCKSARNMTTNASHAMSNTVPQHESSRRESPSCLTWLIAQALAQD